MEKDLHYVNMAFDACPMKSGSARVITHGDEMG